MATFNKILLTGINGQVGHALYPKLQSLGEVIALDRNQLDLSKPDQIRDVVRQIKPDLIINPAAYTNVDKAESEPELAYAINGTAPGILAEEAARLNTLLVHYSTDYVFDGAKPTPYIETDTTNPLSVYGKSKLAGEKAIQAFDAPHLIFRTSWVYGVYGRNFLHTILRLAKEQEKLYIVSDQVGAPTSCTSIVNATIVALKQWGENKKGIYHITNTGFTSWHGFAQEIILQYEAIRRKKNWSELQAKYTNIYAISTSEYPTPAHRPPNSRLDGRKFAESFDITLPLWRDALAQTVRELI